MIETKKVKLSDTKARHLSESKIDRFKKNLQIQKTRLIESENQYLPLGKLFKNILKVNKGIKYDLLKKK